MMLSFSHMKQIKVIPDKDAALQALWLACSSHQREWNQLHTIQKATQEMYEP